MGRECEKFHKSLAEKLAIKKGEKYEDVMRFIRVKLSFLVLKASLLCLRGTRVKTAKATHENEDFKYLLNELSAWNILPEFWLSPFFHLDFCATNNINLIN